ncbi:hypothetical protein [Aureimonas frigidaquae]|uniref:hypothetical protein n=1 Tax=Aureimonas frigidaquae TaxID=424757 RepID=UPI000AD7BFB2|nr:hypothetical protein [Aureimonas frigidaquae]
MSDINPHKPDDTRPLPETGEGGRSPTYEDGIELGEDVPADAEDAPRQTEDRA